MKIVNKLNHEFYCDQIIYWKVWQELWIIAYLGKTIDNK